MKKFRPFALDFTVEGDYLYISLNGKHCDCCTIQDYLHEDSIAHIAVHNNCFKVNSEISYKYEDIQNDPPLSKYILAIDLEHAIKKEKKMKFKMPKIPIISPLVRVTAKVALKTVKIGAKVAIRTYGLEDEVEDLKDIVSKELLKIKNNDKDTAPKKKTKKKVK